MKEYICKICKFSTGSRREIRRHIKEHDIRKELSKNYEAVDKL